MDGKEYIYVTSEGNKYNLTNLYQLTQFVFAFGLNYGLNA